MKELQRTSWSICFLIALAIYLFATCFELTMYGQMVLFSKIGDALKILSMIILAACAVTHIKTYSKIHWIVFILLGAVFALCAYNVRSAAPILLLMFWINVRDVELNDILWVYLIIMSIAFLIAVVLCALGIFPNRVFMGNCYSVGYGYSNGMGVAQLCIVMSYLALRYEKMKWYEWVGILLFTLLSFAACKCKSALIASGAALIICAILRLIDNNWVKQAIGIMGIAIGPVLFIISLLVAKLYNPGSELMNKLNAAFTGRLELGANAVNNYRISALGQQILWYDGGDYSIQEASVEYNIVDSSYLSILINYGWVFTIALMAIYVCFGIYAYKRKRLNWSMLLIVMLLHGMVESSLICINYNPILIAMGFVFFARESISQSTQISISDLRKFVMSKKWIIAILAVAISVLLIVLSIKDGVLYNAGVIESKITRTLDIVVVYLALGLLVGLLLGESALSIIYLIKEYKLKRANNKGTI